MANTDYNYNNREIAKFARALGHPARVAILNFLAIQENCFFGEIHLILPIAKATVSQHLAELKKAGLIQGEIEGPKTRYCINKANWERAQQLISDFFAGAGTDNSCCK